MLELVEGEDTAIFLEKRSGDGSVLLRQRFEKSLASFKILSITALDKDEVLPQISDDPPKIMLTHDVYCRRLNDPTMIRCENCETIFPTKYQFHRHQCDFNAENSTPTSPVESKLDIPRQSKAVPAPKFECEICHKFFISKTNLERHSTIHENSKKTICEHCNKQFVSDNRLRIHKENHCKKAGNVVKFYRSDVTVWKCLTCHEVFSSINTVNVHVETCTEMSEEPNAINDMKFEKISTEILLQCEFCNRTYADKTLLLKHQKLHTTDRNYECVTCKMIFDGYSQATEHWLVRCAENFNLFFLPKLVYCEICERTFKSHEILYNHKIKKKHYAPKLHKSLISNEDFNGDNTNQQPADNALMSDKGENSDKENSSDESIKIKIEPLDEMDVPLENLKKKRGRKRKTQQFATNSKKTNTSIADDGYKYQCESCIKVWDTVAELEKHRQKEHTSNLTCNECGQILQSNKALLIHQRVHKNLKPYVCDTCGRSYSQTSHLWQHMRFHQGIKPFACPHEGCEARYTIRPDLKDHIRKVHTRERPFKCNVCGKCFLTGSVYYQHRLIHTDDRRYGCNICEKRFFRADALNNHRRIHTNEKPYPCWVCGREFRQKGDRNKHIKTQHVLD